MKKRFSVFTDENVSVIKQGKSNAEVEFDNELFLAEQKNGLIIDWKLYRNPAELKEAMQDDIFRSEQRRRGQTEGRVGIVKNCFTGNPAASRIFTFRERHVAWAVLTHNL